ncbi:hypothetical protein ACIB24_06680 [Spongisporangium articulatum]|uniref:PH domain-containing protein n=1 Tax=Spongisporangium articulatum TaxID=3362603 RepID=A0ABW8AK44_9ACTN
MADGDRVTIGAGNVYLGVLWALFFVALAGALLWFGGVGVLVDALYALVPAYAFAQAVVVHRFDVVVIDDRGITVERTRDPVTYAWADILEVGWAGSGAGWPMIAAGLMIRPKGGRFAIPGPNAPARIGPLAVFGRAAHRNARAVLRAECRGRGVPFEDGPFMEAPPPGSPLRRDAPKAEPPGGDR